MLNSQLIGGGDANENSIDPDLTRSSWFDGIIDGSLAARQERKDQEIRESQDHNSCIQKAKKFQGFICSSQGRYE